MHPESFARVIEHHGPQICSLVRGIRPDLRRGATDAEVLAIALPALYSAHRRFDPARGAPFWKFAYHRVRGGVLDEAESEKRRRRTPRVLRAAAILHSLEHELVDDDPETPEPLENRVVRITEPSPEEAFARAEENARLVMLVEALPEIERVVVRGLYLEHRCLDDIALEVGGISRAWASRIHTRALRRLREQLDVP